MRISKTTLAVAVLTATAGLSACGGGGGSSSSSSTDSASATSLSKITDDPANLNGRGDWGSIVISGYGEINAGDSNNQAQSEAVPDGVTRWFGGTDNSDSSGNIDYVVVAETGTTFRPDEEVQGITVEAAGSGTTIDHYQVVQSDDDGIEFFGGALNLKHYVANGVTDDSLDIDLGYQGTVQYALIRQGANFGDRGIESDNNGDAFGATPKSKPTIANITILGNYGNGGSSSSESRAVMHREGFGGSVYRSFYGDNEIVAGATGKWTNGCIDVDDEVDGDMVYGDVYLQCSSGDLWQGMDSGASGASFQEDFSNEVNGTTYDVTDGGAVDAGTLAVTASGYSSNSAYDTVLSNAGLDNVSYLGAVDPSASTPFWDGWTYRDSAVEGNLPGGDFHPLEKEIGDGTISPASTSDCASINSDFVDGDKVTEFGVDFPVCIIPAGRMMTDTTLTNDHIYVLDGTLNVGDGDAESAHDPSTVAKVNLTIEEGTQIFGATGTRATLVITRGSQIHANGSAAMPIIFGGVDAS